jgi:COMPASS component SWD2
MEGPVTIDLAVSKVFNRELSEVATSMDFTGDGKFLLSASEQDLLLIDCEKGIRHKMVKAKKHGILNAHFLHAGPQSVICGSVTGENNGGNLRYWDLYENKYLRFLEGHEAPTCSISVHPYEDLILSGSHDKSVMLWDLRKQNAIAKIPTLGPPAVAFDQQGVVFALSSGKNSVHLFDTRNFEKAEFVHFDLQIHGIIVDVKFSPCGKFLLIATDRGEIFTIDSFRGSLVAVYRRDHDKPGAVPCFSPDSQFVAAGRPDGPIDVWRTDTGQYSAELKGHTSYARQVRFSPSRALLATACIQTALWTPPMHNK